MTKSSGLRRVGLEYHNVVCEGEISRVAEGCGQRSGQLLKCREDKEAFVPEQLTWVARSPLPPLFHKRIGNTQLLTRGLQCTKKSKCIWGPRTYRDLAYISTLTRRDPDTTDLDRTLRVLGPAPAGQRKSIQQRCGRSTQLTRVDYRCPGMSGRCGSQCLATSMSDGGV